MTDERTFAIDVVRRLRADGLGIDNPCHEGGGGGGAGGTIVVVEISGSGTGGAVLLARGGKGGDANRGYSELTGLIAFFPGRVDACFLDDEPVRPQPGSYYGGWITDDVVGPFKGDPGTDGW